MKFYCTVLMCTLLSTGPVFGLILTIKPSNPTTALIITHWLKQQNKKNSCVNVPVDTTKTFHNMMQEAEQKIKNSWKLPVQVCTYGDAVLWALVG